LEHPRAAEGLSPGFDLDARVVSGPLVLLRPLEKPS
jgi:hypothetical protein